MAQAGYFTRVHGSNESFTDDESHLYTVDATPVDHKPRQSHSLSVLSPDEVILKQGYMVKRGSKVKTWKKRWFILTQKELRYYKSEVSKIKENACTEHPPTLPGPIAPFVLWWLCVTIESACISLYIYPTIYNGRGKDT